MHDYRELVVHCTTFTLSALEEANEALISSLQKNASTVAVKGLQMVQLQKAILATGMFSLFEAELQRDLSCQNGLKEALKILKQSGETDLMIRFNHFYLAINVLKHGHGKSYSTLIAETKSLPFRVKMPGEYFFDEGDVSEIATLIEVDDDFVLSCAQLISDVSKKVKSEI